jgi:hypothetical protein
MKTTIIEKAKLAIVTVWTYLISVLSMAGAYGQNDCLIDQYLIGLPHGLELTEKTPQKYLMTAVYYNKDIYGNFSDKAQVSGEYTRGFEDGTVKWNNVRISQSKQLDGVFPEGTKQEYMENFTYKPSEEMVTQSAFEGFPENNPSDFHVKNLVWDMMGFEAFAWAYYDSLKLNCEYAPKSINGKVDLAGAGYFENNNIRLLFSGITKMNGETCAVIQFLAMDNPLQINTEISGTKIDFKGRSHYWGNVLVSLKDKQIEQATLYEDVVMKINIPGVQTDIANTTRELKVEKMN